ncbi:MAG: hypothetical protein ACT4QB_13585 [Gammaproteobacteria bacterium]
MRSNERAAYRSGFEVAEISAEPGNEYLRFSNGRTLRLGEEVGSLREDVGRVQIKHTVKKHLEKEPQIRTRGIKVLSLFFIDRVANYRDYGVDGRPVKGKFAVEKLVLRPSGRPLPRWSTRMLSFRSMPGC